MSVYLIQPAELLGTQHYILGTGLFRRAGARIVVLMETPDPEKAMEAIRSRFQEWFTVKDDHVEGNMKELRSLFYHALLTYEDTRPVKMDIDDPTLFKYLR